MSHVDDVPGGADAQELRHQAGVHDVAAAFGNDLAQNWHSQEREVADDVEDLVTHEFVAEAQACFIQHSFRREYDGVVERPATNQVCASQFVDLVGEAKRARGGDVAAEGAIVQFHKQALHPDHRMCEVYEAIDLICVCRFDTDAAIALFE